MGGDVRSLGGDAKPNRRAHATHYTRMSEEALPTAGAAAPSSPHDWRPERFMVVVAHPDDADFGPAATAAIWIDRGLAGLARLLHERRCGRRGSDARPARPVGDP